MLTQMEGSFIIAKHGSVVNKYMVNAEYHSKKLAIVSLIVLLLLLLLLFNKPTKYI